MEGFKNTTKIQYFKEGGFVTKKEFTKYEKKEDKHEEAKDKVKDTKMIKAGVRQHESALHKGEPKTELKLKCGGRMPKSAGTVKKYKTGGTVENQYAAKKTDKDIKDIANTKRQKPQMLCGGKSVGKYATGGNVSAQGAVSELERQRAMEKMARAKKYLGPAQQSELINQSPAAAGLSGQGAISDAVRSKMTGQGAISDAERASLPMKKGGKAKKC